jgi:circadian clock protein KaiC
MSPLRLESTGNEAFDAALGGGVPAQSVVIVGGEPGSGKTVLTLQAMLHAAAQDKKCIYFTTLSEPTVKLLRYMQQFEFFDADAFAKNVQLFDLGAALRAGADRAMSEIERRVEQVEPSFVVIDSFRAAADLLRGNEGARSFTYDLSVRLAGWGATTFLVGEYARNEVATLPEFAVADGIFMLGSERQGLTSLRELEIMKMRGSAYTSGRHFIEITKAGLSFYPRVRVPALADTLAKTSVKERVSTGIAGLDDMLGGGVPTASSTVVQGGTGSGKTLLCLHYLAEGARRGERGVLFTLEETPEQLRGIADAIGIDVAALEAQGALVVKHTSPVELSTDRFLNELRAEAARGGGRARRQARRARQLDDDGLGRVVGSTLQGARLRRRQAHAHRGRDVVPHDGVGAAARLRRVER